MSSVVLVFSMLSLGRILISNLVVANLLMYSLPGMILLYLAAPFLHQRCCCMKYYIHIAASTILKPTEEETEYVMEGSYLTLKCVGAGYPPPLVQWSKVNELLSDRTSTTNMSMLTNE